MTTSPIPKVRDDDPEDVSWALSTAATSFARGDRAEALKWLRRAAEAASEADCDARAVEIAKAAADLSPPSVPPKVAPPAKPAPKQPPPKPAAKTPTPAPVASGGPPSKRAASKPSKADETGKRSAMRSRPRSLPASDERTVTYVTTEVTKLDARPPHEDADAWPTEAMGAEELDALGEVYGQERTRIGSPAYRPEKPKRSSKPPPPEVRFSQAVHVVVWREADGTLRIAPRGTAVSAVTIEALLVAPAPDVDLIAWLSG